MIGRVDELSVGWTVVVFLTTTAIFPGVMALAVGDCAPAFKAVSPGMPPPMGLVVGLIVGLLAAGS